MLGWEGDQLAGGCVRAIVSDCQSNSHASSLVIGLDGAAPHPVDLGLSAAFLLNRIATWGRGSSLRP